MILFVVNPVSGGMDKKELIADMKSSCFKHDVAMDILMTNGDNDESRLRERIAEVRPKTVVAAGGDGTVSLVAIVLKGSDINMAILPFGSTNGFASETEQEKDIAVAIEKIVAAEHIRLLDLLLVNETFHVLHFGDVGINASIVQHYEKDDGRGLSTYAKHFIKSTREQEPFDVVLKLDGEEKQYTAVELAICNGKKFGSGIPLSNQGTPDDGLFEVVVVEEVNVPIILRAIAASIHEVFYNEKARKVHKATKATLSFKQPQLLQVDGEVMGKYEQLDVQLLRGVVQLIDTGSY